MLDVDCLASVRAAYIEVPRLQKQLASIALHGATVDLLDLTRLQPVHINVDAICRQGNVSIQAIDHGCWRSRYVPSDRFPEVPNSMFAVTVELAGCSGKGGGQRYLWDCVCG